MTTPEEMLRPTGWADHLTRGLAEVSGRTGSKVQGFVTQAAGVGSKRAGLVACQV